MMTPGPRVIYIAGSGRSGSTLLARLLARSPEVVSPGEVRHLLGRDLFRLPADVRCGCGEPLAACTFWLEVRRGVHERLPDLADDEPAALARRVDRIRYLPAVFLSSSGSRFGARLERYRQILRALYGAILEVSGASIVVDESKDLSLLYLLAADERVRLAVLHLVRDGRAVAHSHRRRRLRPEFVRERRYMERYSAWYAAFDWLYRNLGAEGARLCVGDYLRILYEDLAQDADRALARIERRLGCPIEPVGDGVVELGGDHLACGNPSRFRHGPVELRLDDAWRDRMGRSERWLVTVLTWPLLLRYGYLGGGERTP